MKKKTLLMFVLLALSFSLFAKGLNSYFSISSGYDWGKDKKINENVTTTTGYVPVKLEGANYFGSIVGVGYGLGINIPTLIKYGDEKVSSPMDYMPVEVALRAHILAGIPIGKNLRVGGKLGLALSGGYKENAMNFITHISSKITTARLDAILGVYTELAISDSFGLIAGADVSFPLLHSTKTETTVGSTTSTKTTEDKYGRYGISPYIGVALFY